MTQDQVKEVLDRVLTWPPERQQDAAQLLLVLEAQEGECYHPTEDELAAIEKGWHRRSAANLSRCHSSE